MSKLSVLVRWLSSRRSTVVGGSMYPLLSPGERVLVDRFAYRRAAPSRGDVILADVESVGPVIKVVAALNGETVEVRNDRLWINGASADTGRPVVGSLPGRWSLRGDQIFLLSYAAAVGTDSRHFGPVPLRCVRGRVWYVYAPRRATREVTSLAIDLA